ncbi:MAG: DUF3307 domain-containing protein [Candidatus Margulisbacteria bacterium]|nr:DUF3307 domain-containing protein [Candidatus Margulisiibacteriota bacterium]MBU1021765.1 DUF3307 domain-containing protein [Candidatus Margulisiibacteriota bacterium]MBU1729511.1 DUF3307 domain-containing protein [Candidatus Margulisiibacteriota bacterium]MBU1955388.1 DUF3307 domain-containing protein [Candidatus Margulisiibacteriota bacterium]
MYLFYRLLLAHLIADFVLQTKQVEKLKTLSFWGVVFHGLIFLALCILICLPFLTIPAFAVYLILLSISHVLIDYFRHKIIHAESLWTGIIDQLLHFAFIALVIPLSYNYPALKLNLPYFSGIYNNSNYILYLIGIIAATYPGGYVIAYAKKIISYDQEFHPLALPGFIERLAIVLLIFWEPRGIYFVPLIVSFKLIYYSTTKALWENLMAISGQENIGTSLQKIKTKQEMGIEFIGSPALAIMVGLIIKGLIA